MHCEWGQWETWGPCSVTCGVGTQTSTRDKKQQARNEGNECEGKSTRNQSCITKGCPCDDATKFSTAPIEGKIGLNNISTTLNVKSEEQCHSSCILEPRCEVYTYHSGFSLTNPNTCYLLSALEGPFKECEEDACVTGWQFNRKWNRAKKSYLRSRESILKKNQFNFRLLTNSVEAHPNS